MRLNTPRILRWLAVICGGAALFQFPITGNSGVGGGGCATFATNGLMNSIDFCYLLDCENGFFGGAVQPCGDGSSSAQPFLLDCTNSTGGNSSNTTVPSAINIGTGDSFSPASSTSTGTGTGSQGSTSGSSGLGGG